MNAALLGVELGPKGSARQRYAVAMSLYQAGRIGAEVLEAYRIAAAHDSRDPADLLGDLGLPVPVAQAGGFTPPATIGSRTDSAAIVAPREISGPKGRRENSNKIQMIAEAALSDDPHYPPRLIALLEAVWGEGFLSPGGVEEVARAIGSHDLTGKTVLDIGCGAGGIDIALVEVHGAGYVTALDVEDPVLDHARGLVAARGLSGRIGFVKVAPGPLPFPPATFDVVFSKDSIVHIADKRALMEEVFRVLKPGGWFLASDWLIGHDEAPSPRMAAYIAEEGLDFGMASPAAYQRAIAAAGFAEISATSRNLWYRTQARVELGRLQGDAGGKVAAVVGQDFVDRNLRIWQRMIPVLDSGEHCPTHLAARKPALAPSPPPR